MRNTLIIALLVTTACKVQTQPLLPTPETDPIAETTIDETPTIPDNAADACLIDHFDGRIIHSGSEYMLQYQGEASIADLQLILDTYAPGIPLTLSLQDVNGSISGGLNHEMADPTDPTITHWNNGIYLIGDPAVFEALYGYGNPNCEYVCDGGVCVP